MVMTDTATGLPVSEMGNERWVAECLAKMRVVGRSFEHLPSQARKKWHRLNLLPATSMHAHCQPHRKRKDQGGLCVPLAGPDRALASLTITTEIKRHRKGRINWKSKIMGGAVQPRGTSHEGFWCGFGQEKENTRLIRIHLRWTPDG